MPKIKRTLAVSEFRVEFILSPDPLKHRRTNRREQPPTVLVMRGNDVLAMGTLLSTDLDGFFQRGRGGDV
jgi:hypothetical protein